MLLNPIEGEIFNIDKPLGWTSFAAVKKIRATGAICREKEVLQIT